MDHRPPIRVSRFDFERLERLLDRVESPPERLREELDRAEILEPADVPADLVTMNSTVRFVDEATGAERSVRLVFPGQADSEKQWISILAPVGSALLGLKVGDHIDWPFPNGAVHRLRVTSIEYQPEAAGDLHL